MRLVADERERLDKFLARAVPEHSRSRLSREIEEGKVLVGGKECRPSTMLEPGVEVTMEEISPTPPHDLSPAAIPLEVVYEDDDLLVVNKPRGLAAHPASSLQEPSLVNALLARGSELSRSGGDFRPGIVHRLDKDTTGLMVVAKNDTVHVNLARQFEGKTAERRYVLVVAGRIERERMRIEAPIGRSQRDRRLMTVEPKGKAAVTHVKRLAWILQGTLMAARLDTGRTHQIRVHMSGFGMPILGDSLYAPPLMSQGPLQLHAGFLRFTHPRTSESVCCFAMPDEQFMGREMVSVEVLEPF